MSDDLIAIKGNKDGLLISLSPTEQWLAVTDHLAARIDDRVDFFAGADITVDLGERPVPKYELSSLRALLERRGLALSLVLSESETTRESAIALDLKTDAKGRDGSVDLRETLPVSPQEQGTRGVLFRRTLRSGRTLQSDGHVVIFGDVNPGAEVIAAGDIVVWGKLRGVAHAGVNGDETAIVCALDMNPSQLRIAGYFATSPPGRQGQVLPEVARVQGEQIVVEARE